ncbi:CsgG/HfaB family protein [Ottowia thiooxydans]|uniref:Curli biogenesis system outer membrane secretion channel CsgG n=1 Tax=Ottowia thiooxydans TaxID=219182 RepID=A0ABV2Q580_9BURK
MRKIKICTFVLLVSLLSACSKKEEVVAAAPPSPSPAPAASTPAQPEAKNNSPDFGGVTKVSREVEAVGTTQELAVISALQSAVAQVNGVRVASQMQGFRSSLSVSTSGQGGGSAQAEGFSQKLIAASQGAVTGYEILSQEEIDKLDEQTVARVRASDGGYSYSASASTSHTAKVDASESGNLSSGQDKASYSGSFAGSSSSDEKANLDIRRGASSYESDLSQQKMRSYWKVRVRVDVAQYRAPDEQGRPKIVVALPKTSATSYAVGDGRTNSVVVASAVRGRLSDILTQTKRFIVLDREFGSEMQAEIDHINSGNVRVQDSARLGQQLATDLILIPTIERFEYPRSVRKLRMSDRELVSYSGGGRITLRLLNAATGEVVMSDSFEHKLASADPSTLPRVINGASMVSEMMDSLAGQIGGAVVTEIFPITVVSMTGDQVVLSQGGESLKTGQHWQAVSLGEELKDPQTGRSLGRHENPLGTIRVDRVSAQTSYGTLVDGAESLSGKPFKPGDIVLRHKVAGKAPASKPIENQTLATSAKPTTARPARENSRATQSSEPAVTSAPRTPPPGPAEDKW